MDEDFAQAFAAVVREEVTQNGSLKVDGIGTFKRHHETQYQQKYKDGRVVMMPPKDTIEFLPDSKWTND